MTLSAAPMEYECEVSPDLQLARRVKNFLLSKQVLGNVCVDAQAGTVTLIGKVSSFYHKQMLLHGAMRVAGVIEVVDDVEVAKSGK